MKIDELECFLETDAQTFVQREIAGVAELRTLLNTNDICIHLL